MRMEAWNDATTHARHFRIDLTDADIIEAYGKMTPHDRLELDYFGRSDASLEERLMGLQVYARVLERDD